MIHSEVLKTSEFYIILTLALMYLLLLPKDDLGNNIIVIKHFITA